MRFPYSCGVFACALCALANGDAHAGTEPRLCARVQLTADEIPPPAGDPLQQAARELAHRLLRLDLAVEHGAIFYRSAGSTIRTGSIAIGDRDQVELPIATRPGETVAGALHTHARYAYHTGNQARLSREDIVLGQLLLTLPETDRAVRLFIVDSRYGTLSEYAVAGRCGATG